MKQNLLMQMCLWQKPRCRRIKETAVTAVRAALWALTIGGAATDSAMGRGLATTGQILLITGVGGNTAAQAALKVADIYRISGDKGKEVTQLRLVLVRYPKSGQSSEAHNRLESYGVALTGGEAKAED